MKTRNLLRFSVLIIISLFLCFSSCPPPLPGDITGTVKDAKSSEPICQAKIKLITSDDTTSTGIDGTYLLKNIPEGDYEIKASKNGYAPMIEHVSVIEAMTKTINFSLTKIPTINVSSKLLDFGIDSTLLRFNISIDGTGSLRYEISTSRSWISTSPFAGEITGETDTATVTVNINKTDIEKKAYKEETIIVSDVGKNQEVKIYVYLNGLLFKSGSDSEYRYVVRIGTQVWMGENENVGTRIDGSKDQTDNGITEKYCYNDGEYYCDTYGGLYQWNEMMKYNLAEDTSQMVGTTQGICPQGWHIPTDKEWRSLCSYVGEDGGKLKETGTVHWASPNVGATNESGFSGLPGGVRNLSILGVPQFEKLGIQGAWWTTNIAPLTADYHDVWVLQPENAISDPSPTDISNGLSVRCIKNP